MAQLVIDDYSSGCIEAFHHLLLCKREIEGQKIERIRIEEKELIKRK
jgi:hypothetical protein